MKNYKNTPLVSIIITNYNKVNFLIECLSSCINQTYKNREIIFFDDNSTENSLKRVRNFIKKKKYNLKIISNLKKKKDFATNNHILAIEKSLNKAKGKYIFLLDSDDYFDKNKLKEIVQNFENNKNLKFILDLPYLKFKNKIIKKRFNFKLVKNKWPKFPPTSCMSFEKKTLKKVIKKINFKNFPNLAIDFRLAVFYAQILKYFFIYKKYLTYYRQVDDGMDSKYTKYRSNKWWIRREEAFKFLNLILKKNKLPTNRGLDFFLTKLFNKIFIS